MDQYQQLKEVIQKAVPEIMQVKEPENWWITKVEIVSIVKDTIGDAYQKQFNKNLDYDQWVGIRDHMEDCAGKINEKIIAMLALTREAIGRPIRFVDLLVAIIKHFPENLDEQSERLLNSIFLKLMRLYNALDDDLDHQTEETKQFLISLLVK